MERANDASNGGGDLGGGHVIKTEDDEKVTIKVQKEGMADFSFTMNRDQPLRKLMIAFCERLSLGDYNNLCYYLATKKKLVLLLLTYKYTLLLTFNLLLHFKPEVISFKLSQTSHEHGNKDLQK